MFRFTFVVEYATKDGENAAMTSQVELDTDNIFDARAQLVYQLSRNPHVFAPFDFTNTNIEKWNGETLAWEAQK